MKIKSILLAVAMMAAARMGAQNPIVSTMYTPDPAPFVYGDKVYLFVDHDEDDAEYFKMKDWLLYSTEDMVNWTYLGTMVTTETFAWARHGDRAWASQAVERNGKWYWYLCCNTADGGDALAVAVADRPEGPWTDAIGAPLAIGFGYIDPTVFIDDDGQAYLFWGNKGLWYGKLNEDMISFADGYQEVPGYHDPACFGELQYKENWANGGKKELMTQYEEGPWMMKRNGTYILSYPAGGVPEHMAYSTAPTIDGPWTYRGRIMDEAENSFTIHGGNISFAGRNFMFYHNGALPNGGGFRRSTCIEEFEFNADGSFPFIPFTKEGVKTPVRNLDPYKRVEAETNAQAFGLKNDSNNGQQDHFIQKIHDGDWLRVRAVDFRDCGQKAVTVVLGSQKGSGTIEFYTDNMDGEPFAKAPVNTDNAGFKTASFTYLINTDVKGVHDLYLKFRCDVPEPFELDWWQFNSHANMPVVQTKFTADPAPMVIGDEVFLFTTHDEDGAKGFNMYDWLLYTSKDMVNWTDCGAVASLDDFTYFEGKNGAWAEQVIERNGKYYMYCPIHGHGIGVLVAESPYGPYKDVLGKPLAWQGDWNDIDPTVLIDDDGQAYMYWGNPELFSVKLNEDMISLAGPIVKHPKIQDYQEGPWIWKRNGHYYLAFASTCCPEGIGYAMSDSPEGPWEYKGHIMDHTVRTRGNHPGIIDFGGKSYVFGLCYDIMHLKTFDHAEQRSVSRAEMHYNEDGTIQQVPYFLDNVVEQFSTVNPFERVEAETMAWGYGLKNVPVEGSMLKTPYGKRQNFKVTDIDNGEYILVRGVDFKEGASKFTAMLATSSTDGRIEIHLDSLDGTPAGTLTVSDTAGKLKKLSCWLSADGGVHDVYLLFKGTGIDSIDYWSVK